MQTPSGDDHVGLSIVADIEPAGNDLLCSAGPWLVESHPVCLSAGETQAKPQAVHFIRNGKVGR
jgi:hypothetical protein